jgi:ribosome-binding protein aMBF1 (putative translation factor)
MKTEKRKKLEGAGWKVGGARELLALTPDESDFVEIKLALARRLRTLREKHNWTQAELAKHVGSSHRAWRRWRRLIRRSVSIFLSVLCWPPARTGGSLGG